MYGYAARRLIALLPMLAGVVFVVFALMHAIPGDPARVLLGDEATPEAVANLRRTLGLDLPLHEQFAVYVAKLLNGDLGRSLFQNETVAGLIAQRLPATMEVALLAILLSAGLGILLGTIAAVRQGSLADLACMGFAQLGVSMPVFWLGILLMYLFAVELRVLPAIGRGEPVPVAFVMLLAGDPATFFRSLSHLVLPALALGLTNAAVVSRLVRAAMLEVLTHDFVRTARAKGLPRGAVIRRHALRNALLPVVSVIGLQSGTLLGGAVLTEVIFGWPGIGQLIVNAISQRDIPLVQGTLLVYALIFALVNLTVDLLLSVIDPRIRLR